MDEGTVAILAAQSKYLTAKYSHHAAYEVVQTMGGRGAINEPGSSNMINRGENLSRLMEVIGGHRNIQLMIIEAGIKAIEAGYDISDLEQVVSITEASEVRCLNKITGLKDLLNEE